MGVEVTTKQITDALAARWHVAEAARQYKTTVEQIEAAEARAGVLLPRASTSPARPMDEEGLYRQLEDGKRFRTLAAEEGVHPSTLTRRLRRWVTAQRLAGRTDLRWPPRQPVAERLYEARARTLEASARAGLATRGRAPSGASWVDAAAEAGANPEAEAQTQQAARQTRSWARNQDGYPWPIRASAPWTEEQRADRAVQLRAELGRLATTASAAAELAAASDGALVLLQVYAEHDDVDALRTAALEPPRAFHHLRAEAAQLLDVLTDHHAGAVNGSVDRARESIVEMLAELGQGVE